MNREVLNRALRAIILPCLFRCGASLAFENPEACEGPLAEDTGKGERGGRLHRGAEGTGKGERGGRVQRVYIYN